MSDQTSPDRASLDFPLKQRDVLVGCTFATTCGSSRLLRRTVAQAGDGQHEFLLL